MSLPCFKCGKELEDAMPDVKNQPYAGLSFTSPGHYGGTVFDPMNHEFLELNICDDCLVVGKENVLLGYTKVSRSVEYQEWDPNEQ